MRRTILLAATLVILSAPAQGQDQRSALEGLTKEMVNLENSLRQEPDALKRKRLAEEIEKLKHQMGPVDARGAPVRCRAMWHETAIDWLEVEMKRLAGRPGGLPVSANLLRLHTRRMAKACLTHGWRIRDGRVKYQVDVVGQYLVNNLPLLDSLYDSVGNWATRKLKAGDAGVYTQALDKARQGAEQMGRAAEALATMPSDPDTALVPWLGEFVAGLRGVREADLAVREALQRKEKSEPAATAPPEGEAEPPPMTAEEEARLAKVKEAAAGLKEGDWVQVGLSLESFTEAVAGGFQIAAARPRAREFLARIEQAVRLIADLRASKAAPPEYLARRAGELLRACRLMETPQSRIEGYTRLSGIGQEDLLRRQVEAAGLSREVAQGLVGAYYILRQDLDKDEKEGGDRAAAQDIGDGCRRLASDFEKMATWPPADMATKLLDAYKRMNVVFRKDVAAAAATLATDRKAGIARLKQAADHFDDLQRIVRCDTIVKAVAKYRPPRAPAVYNRVADAAQALVAKSASPDAARKALEDFIRPFESLDRFPLLEPEYLRAVQALVGRTYPAAVATLTQELAAGIDAASEGNGGRLWEALESQYLFGLLRRRAPAITYHLDNVHVSNLVVFSIPEKPWSQFMDFMGQGLKNAFAQYPKPHGNQWDFMRPLRQMEEVYRSVAAGQRLTLDASTEGETDLDRLVRNLEGAAVSDPDGRTWRFWLIGYHVTEAAVATAAGLEAVGDWHRDFIRRNDGDLRDLDLAPPRAVSPARQ